MSMHTTAQIVLMKEQPRDLGLGVATEAAMLFFYLPMILFGAMFGANANSRVRHPDDPR
jgi:hypothetical protein